MKKSYSIFAILPFLLAADPIVSGPQPGQRPGPYSFLVATGAHRGQSTCFICETAEKPAAIVFTRKLTPALGKLMVELDTWVGKQPADSVNSWMTVLGEKTETADNLAKWSQTIGLKKTPVGVFDDADGPPSYRLNKDAEVTVILFVNSKVVSNFTLKADELGDGTIEKIKGDLSKLKK